MSIKGKSMSVLHVPDDLLKRLGPNNASALLEIACRLCQTGPLKFDEAARLANVDLDAFAAACVSRKIPVYWYRSEDLLLDLDTLKRSVCDDSACNF
jgi:predicted HTH domain antitoxin